MRLGQAKVLRQYRQSFYPNGIKVVPAVALERLTELGLAVWCMDDGGLRGRRRLTLATDGWPLEAQDQLVAWFRERWGLTPRIERCGLRRKPHVIHGRLVKSSKITYRLTFAVNDTVKLLRLMAPHVHQIFREKWRLDDPATFRPAMTHAERGRAGMDACRRLYAAGVLVRRPGFARGHTYVKSLPPAPTAAAEMAGQRNEVEALHHERPLVIPAGDHEIARGHGCNGGDFGWTLFG
jgi:hypothetical protein